MPKEKQNIFQHLRRFPLVSLTTRGSYTREPDRWTRLGSSFISEINQFGDATGFVRLGEDTLKETIDYEYLNTPLPNTYKLITEKSNNNLTYRESIALFRILRDGGKGLSAIKRVITQHSDRQSEEITMEMVYKNLSQLASNPQQQ